MKEGASESAGAVKEKTREMAHELEDSLVTAPERAKELGSEAVEKVSASGEETFGKLRDTSRKAKEDAETQRLQIEAARVGARQQRELEEEGVEE